MKQIVVISGKGGTGKTVVTGALAALAENKVMVDCDVDAADLHLLLHPQIRERHEFRSGKSAVRDEHVCQGCGMCLSVCRFGAVGSDYRIEPFSCEGCGLCSLVCPHGAIWMEEKVAGAWFVSDTRYGPFVHARLGTAEENSGKLVAKVRQVAKEMAEEQNASYVIIDGPPGIGCPVIASLSGVDCALVVTEPTLSGLHDAQRVIELARHFHIPVNLVINKYDLNPVMAGKIQDFCHGQHVPVIGKIVFDPAVVQALVAGKTVVDDEGSTAGDAMRKIWEALR